jgi:Zn-dependent M28 family amino/carboxypeptidase
VSALGVDQSSLGTLFTRAAAAEGLRVSASEEALLRGYFFRSDHFPFVRAGVPALSMQSGVDFVGRPSEFAARQEAEYSEKRYHQTADNVLPGFRYDGAEQVMKVIVRAALAAANAPGQPKWNRNSEFREAGEARLRE